MLDRCVVEALMAKKPDNGTPTPTWPENPAPDWPDMTKPDTRGGGKQK